MFALGRIINTVIFPIGSKLGAKKTLTFKRKDDFVASLTYKNAEIKSVVYLAIVFLL